MGGRVQWLSGPEGIARLPGIDRLSGDDLRALERAADELSTDVDALATIMSTESGFDPGAVNPFSDATGLIQFMPATARALGTSVQALRQMSFQQQMPYVVKFYQMVGCVGVSEVGALYVCTFCPALKGKPDDFVVARQGAESKGPCGTERAVYDQNKGLDHDKDGILTAGDVKSVVRTRLARATGRIEVPVRVASSKKGGGWKWLVAGAAAGAAAVAFGVV